MSKYPGISFKIVSNGFFFSFFFFTSNTIIGPDLEATLKAIRSGKVTDEEVNRLMQVFDTSGTKLF